MHNLKSKIRRFNNNAYSLYEGLLGEYQFPQFTLRFDEIQPDPFAPPSKATLIIPFKQAGFALDFLENPIFTLSFCDSFARTLAREGRRICTEHKGSGNSGLFGIRYGHQKIIENNAVLIKAGRIEARVLLGLPAYGRKISADEALSFLCAEIPELIAAVCLEKYNAPFLKAAQLLQRQFWLRDLCRGQGLIAFVGNNSVLPRSGGADAPLPGALAFASPKEWETSFSLPDGFVLRGMGIPKGITLIAGGGYHGKSTLLSALAQGVYNHIGGDGREYCLTVNDAVFLRAEDGRPVAGADISPFIHNLPGGKDSSFFVSDSASGSSSQAANLIEALEAGSRTFLLDEDISATNFLIRDARMRLLVPQETITPLAAALPHFKGQGFSLIMVSGALGGLLAYADRVLTAENYQYKDATQAARRLVKDNPPDIPAMPSFKPKQTRIILDESISFEGKKKRSMVEGAPKVLRFGREEIDLSLWHQLEDYSQYGTLAAVLAYAKKRGYFDSSPEAYLGKLREDTGRFGWDLFSDVETASWRYITAVRSVDIHAALCRLRSLSCRPL